MTNLMWGQNLFGMPHVLNWILPLLALDLVLKGFALWRSARNNQLYWFIALLIINSAGILPALYLILAQKKSH